MGTSKMYLLVRKESHVDDRYWVFDSFNLAKQAADILIDYWINEYGVSEEDNEENLIWNEEDLYVYQAEDSFTVQVSLLDVWEE